MNSQGPASVWKLDFLEKLVESSKANARLATAKLRPRKQCVEIEHALMRKIECWFDGDQLTGSTIKQVFVIRCNPKRECNLDEHSFRTQFNGSGLTGELGFGSGEVVFQYQWGTDSEAAFPTHNARKMNRLIEWIHSVLLLLFNDIERSHEVLRPTVNEETDETHYVIALEKYLEDFLVAQWDSLPWAEDLEYVDRQVPCGDHGELDILARDRQTGDFVVIELKRDKAERQVVGQLSSYMGWVGEHQAKAKNVGVRGIIVARLVTEKLRVAALPHNNIELFEYEMAVKLRHHEQTHQVN